MSDKKEFTLIYKRNGIDEDEFAEAVYAEIGGDIDCLIGAGHPDQFAVEIVGDIFDLVSAAAGIAALIPDVQIVDIQESV